jgi:hypothetical protein
LRGIGQQRQDQRRGLEHRHRAPVRCGIVSAQGRAVGVPFVGTMTAALVLGQVLRELSTGTSFEVIAFNLRTP